MERRKAREGVSWFGGWSESIVEGLVRGGRLLSPTNWLVIIILIQLYLFFLLYILFYDICITLMVTFK